MLAAAGEFAFTTSTRGDNEKTAVTPTANVINSGHLYLLTRRNVEACTCLALLNGTDWCNFRRTTFRYDDTPGTARGKVTTTRLPWPGSEVSEISAPCSRAIQLAMESPRPAPSVRLRAVSPRKNL